MRNQVGNYLASKVHGVVNIDSLVQKNVWNNYRPRSKCLEQLGKHRFRPLMPPAILDFDTESPDNHSGSIKYLTDIISTVSLCRV